MSRSPLPGRRVAGAVLAAATAAAFASVVAASPAAAAPAPAQVLGVAGAAAVPNSYIVKYKDTALLASPLATRELTDTLASRAGATVTARYTSALRGFAGTMTAAAAARLAADPAVELVQQDAYSADVLLGTQPNPPSWGVDRVDQRDLPLNASYTYPDVGSNVRIYVTDTGVRTTHSDFGGRASHGRDTIDDDNDATDCQGHGTHVAGTTAGTAFGVAKLSRVVGVRMLDCAGGGSVANAVEGIDWVTANAVKPAVANASWGFPVSLDPGGLLSAAAVRSMNSGVVWVFAAGNESSTTCTRAPQNNPTIYTVMASTRTDGKASFSNYGNCGDIFAPGDAIISASHTSDTGSRSSSGTSMAAPHVAGGAALYLATNPTATQSQVESGLAAAASLNKITNPGAGSPNRLLYVGAGGGQPGAPTVANPGARTSTVGQATSLQMTASGGTTPYTWSASGLPAGLSINSGSGLISGTPTTAGTSTVTVSATGGGQTGSTQFSWTVNPTGGTCAPQTNGTDVAIPDAGGYVYSNLTFSCSGSASASTQVAVDIRHTYRGDLQIHLIAPDGTAYLLKNSSSGDSADNVIATYTVNASSEARTGQWRLRVRDVYSADTGYINSFGLTL